MKLETLVLRYKTLGFVPNNGTTYDEVNGICKWLYENYKVYVSENYCDWKVEITPAPYLKFTGTYRFNTGTEHSTNFYCEKRFTDPFEARFDALVHLLPGFRFQYKLGS